MPDILVDGQWERLSLVSDGAVHISLVSAVAAQLEVSGTTRPPKYLGPAHDVAAFPASAVADSEPVGIRARTVTGDPFPGDGVIDLAVDSIQGGQSFLSQARSVRRCSSSHGWTRGPLSPFPPRAAALRRAWADGAPGA